MDQETSSDDLNRIATAAGLPRLSDRQLAQLGKSLASARELAGKLPKDLHWSDELALTFRLPTAGEAP